MINDWVAWIYQSVYIYIIYSQIILTSYNCELGWNKHLLAGGLYLGFKCACVCCPVRCRSFMTWCRSGMPCPLLHLRWCRGLLLSRSCTSKVTHNNWNWFTLFQTCFVSLYQVLKRCGKGGGIVCHISLPHGIIWMYCCWLISFCCRYCNNTALGGNITPVRIITVKTWIIYVLLHG